MKTKQSKTIVTKPKLQSDYSSNLVSSLPSKKEIIKTNFNQVNLNIFFIFITTNTTPFVQYSRPHANYALLFMDHNRHNSFTLNLKKCYMR